jgi:hypothetical protein
LKLEIKNTIPFILAPKIIYLHIKVDLYNEIHKTGERNEKRAKEMNSYSMVKMLILPNVIYRLNTSQSISVRYC